jgi:hypothetical protein
MGRITQLISMLVEKRVGFMMDEVMSGTHRFVGSAGPAGEHPMMFRVTWGNRRLERFMNPLSSEFMSNFLQGTVTVGGLVDETPCSGKLDLLYFTEAKIRYTFTFEDSGGRELRYVGEKIRIRPWNLHRTHTTCYGTITDSSTGSVISRSTLYFKWHTIPAFIMSFRLG